MINNIRYNNTDIMWNYAHAGIGLQKVTPSCRSQLMYARMQLKPSGYLYHKVKEFESSSQYLLILCTSVMLLRDLT